MSKKTLKAGAMVALAGMLFQFGGCLGLGGNSIWSRVITDGVLNLGWEFVTDNDGIFDLFEGGATATNP